MLSEQHATQRVWCLALGGVPVDVQRHARLAVAESRRHVERRFAVPECQRRRRVA